MRFDVDLHRQTIKLPDRLPGGKPLEMSVIDAGPSSGDKYATQTMVFIHGFGGRAAYWEYQLEQFQSDYRVIALDLRGHGYTDAPTEADGARYDVPELVGDIEAALAQLRVPARFVLVCHSFGGALSSYFINKHPQRVSALVIIASAVTFRLRTGGRMLLRVPPAILTWLRGILPLFGYNARMYPPAHVVYLQNRNGLSLWDGAEYLRAIKTPTLIVLGQRDILFNVESYKELAQLVPNAEEVVIPVSAHQVMVERPDAVNRAIERFLQSQVDPVALAEYRSAQKALRREARKQLEAERPWLKFYDARTPYRIKLPTVPLPRLLETTARRFGNTVALDYLGGSMSWRELEKSANRFAHGLIARGMKPGERAMLLLPNSPQWVIAYFGILKAGLVAVLTDADSETALVCDRLAQSGAAVLIAGADRDQVLRAALQSDPRVAGVRQVIFAPLMAYAGWRERFSLAALRQRRQERGLHWFRLDDPDPKSTRRYCKFSDMLTRGSAMPPEVTLRVEDTAAVAYTFGGTGGTALPVPLTHRNLAANALQLRHWLPESRPGDERFLAQQPLSSAYGLTGLLHLGVYLGATLILLPGADLNQLLKTVHKKRPTFFPTTPKMVRKLAQTPGVSRYGLASIRVCAVSGAPLPQEIREEFEKITRGRLIEAYGLVEASPAVLAMPLATRRQVGVVGLPLPDTEAKIVDLDSGAAVALDVLGELCVRGPQVFAGYDERDARGQALTAARLKDGWLATGDIASMDEDGFFTIVDRKDNMLVRDGQRIFPRQVEEVLFEHPAVAHAHVTRRTNEFGATLHAQLMLHHNMNLTEDALRRYCAKRLHPAALPDSIVIELNKPAA